MLAWVADAVPSGGALAVVIAAGVVLCTWLLLSPPSAPSISVPLEGAEVSDDALSGPSCPQMALKDYEIPGFIQCYDPATLQRLGQVEAMTKARVEEVVGKAKAAQAKWCLTSFKERKRVLQCLQNYILSHQDDICRVASRDSGKPKLDALLGEVITTCEKIRCIMANGEAWLRPESRPTGPLMVHKNATVEYQPLGVLGVIAPWNYPFHNVYNHVISGIFAGNAVVSKVSEYTCWSSRYFGAIMREVLLQCGHDPELCQIVTGFGEAGAALVACPDVDKVIFTGSPEIGKKVMEGAAPHLKPVILELGGKDPMILCEDVSVKGVLPMVMRGVYQNCGQNCCGVERMYVYEGVYDEFVAAATAQVKGLRQGPALGVEPVDCGAMVMPGQLDIVQRLVDDAVKKGARLLTGGKRNANLPKGLFYEPTVLADVTHDMRIANEEVFGPVMTIIKVEGNSDEDCLAMVNSSDYGLGSSVFSSNQKRATLLGERIRCGMTTVNDFGVNYLVQSLPFGGVKHSGFDRFAGPEGLRACCLQKSVVVDKTSWIQTTIPGLLQYPIAPGGMTFGKAMVNVVYGPTLTDRVKAVFGMLKASRM